MISTSRQLMAAGLTWVIKQTSRAGSNVLLRNKMTGDTLFSLHIWNAAVGFGPRPELLESGFKRRGPSGITAVKHCWAVAFWLQRHFSSGAINETHRTVAANKNPDEFCNIKMTFDITNRVVPRPYPVIVLNHKCSRKLRSDLTHLNPLFWSLHRWALKNPELSDSLRIGLFCCCCCCLSRSGSDDEIFTAWSCCCWTPGGTSVKHFILQTNFDLN